MVLPDIAADHYAAVSGVVAVDGMFLAAGFKLEAGGKSTTYLARSKNGIDWTVTEITILDSLYGTIYRFQYLNGTYYLGISALAGEKFYASTDLARWTDFGPMNGARSLAASAGRIVAVGSGFAAGVKIAVSADGGTTWKRVISRNRRWRHDSLVAGRNELGSTSEFGHCAAWQHFLWQ